MIRIVIADDHAMVREGLKQLISAAPDLIVAGEAQNGNGVIQCVRELDFEVLVLDLSMPGRSGPELIRQVHTEKPKLRILILSMHQEPQYAVRAIKSGASGYLTKDNASVDLMSAIRKVAGGGAFITAEVAEQIALSAMPDAKGLPHSALSNREFEVFDLLVEGHGISHIAELLNLSVKTVSTHKARILQKMNLQNRADLIRYAISHRLTDDPEPMA
ncbi:DNA-binding response regulator [Georgfuchsia toluolica]|uniref:DNA-binding response regulator n=1 Tax=Georgfuchsia toluolica TaxID=424218 RepID=A0A916N8Y7_9PROT|nr:response regulator transcription factor [Georgfuchsia toluolica]CAG4883165.1 DNA-binding response regulator [Georgfuchsia toluolica]